MRANIVFIVLLVMLGAFAGGMVLRERSSHSAPSAPADGGEPDETAPGASASASAAASASASASAVASAAPVAPGPKLGRPLRVVGLGWELLAPGVMANDGVQPGAKSLFKKQGLEVELDAHLDVANAENALARGGKHEKGADVALLPLPTFVTSYERLKALQPVIFFVAAWSEGREIVVSKHDSFAKLPAKGEVKLEARAGEPAAFLGLFALDLAGVSPDRVTLVDKDAEWLAIIKNGGSGSRQADGNVLMSTAEASRLVPFVAIAQASWIAEQPKALEILTRGWLEGHQQVASSASDAARKIAETKGAPEPLAVLSRLGELAPASLAENAHLAGLAGRGAVTLETLFQRSWRIWRDAKVLSIPPETAPVDGTIIAALVRGGAGLTTPAKAPGKDHAAGDDKALIVARMPKGKLDEEKLLDEIGFLAGVFRRSPIRVSVHPRFALDKKLTDDVLARARERFDLSAERLVAGTATPQGGATATLEVMPVP